MSIKASILIVFGFYGKLGTSLLTIFRFFSGVGAKVFIAKNEKLNPNKNEWSKKLSKIYSYGYLDEASRQVVHKLNNK